MKPKLSVCIPTYNRCEILKDTLEGVITFFVERNVEVCISNNASTDGTDEYIKELVRLYPSIKYNKQVKNVSIDENMVDVILMATGDYIFPLGDDDKIDVRHIENEIFDSICDGVDLKIFNGRLGENYLLETDLLGSSFDNLECAFESLWSKMPFGSFMFHRDLLVFMQKDNRFMNTSHAYTGIIWDGLYAKKVQGKQMIRIVCGQEPLIEFKQEKKTWEKDRFKILYYEIPLWFYLLLDKYPVISNKRILKKYLIQMSSFKTLLRFKCKNPDFSNHIREYMSFFSYIQRKKALLINSIPSNILNNLYNFVKRWKKKKLVF
ncbi:glycosyltransferase family 2 protein [Capnocytophaga canis]|uniref:glycosyltransferase family 2 protein n=1 Tax=Capnocytophaga canis TaxID=1848903 RepID=UPI001562C540|nr:glycosyltransferase family 2 protein [Capnocytophaga canis]